MNTHLQQQLDNLSKQQLVNFIASLEGFDKELDKRIDTLCIVNDSKALEKALKKRVQSLKRSTRFVPYRESAALASNITLLLQDIHQLLLPLAPKAAFKLIDQFLQTTTNTFNRCDDSNGYIGDIYKEAVLRWLEYANVWLQSELPCKEDWLAHITHMFHHNDYGIFDELITHSRELLSETALRQLAEDFKKAADRALNNTAADGYNAAASHAACGLQCVAIALHDAELFETSILLTSPKPNSMQRRDIVKFCLEIKDAERALTWLQEPWSINPDQRLILLDQCFAQLKRPQEMLKVRRQHYQQHPSFESLCHLLEVTDDTESEALKKQAFKDAHQLHDLTQASRMLVQLQAFDAAAQLLLDRHEEMETLYWGFILPLAKDLAESQQHLGAALCYRTLLNDILARGNSQAYGHAARYYKALATLDKHINDYQNQPDHQTYTQNLHQQHGRKSSFWERLE